MNETINERIKSIIKERFKGNASAFAREVGIKQPTLNTIIGERQSKPSFEILNAIALNTNINSNWLLTGEGDMLSPAAALSVIGNSDISSDIRKLPGVPYYENIEGTCGIVSQFNDNREAPTFFINYEHFNDCNAYIPVVGDSMYPQYCSGEIIAVKRIYNMDIIQWGEAYFIVTNDNANCLKTVKLVHPHEDSDKIILRASNPNFKGDTVINKADIISMFIIKGKIKRNQL